MPNEPNIEKDLETLANGLKQLEAQYNMFFAGRLPRPPVETRRRIETLLRYWDGEYIQASADRFRFEVLQTRFYKFADLWDRGLRAREEGRPGPFSQQAPKTKAKKPEQPEAKVLHVTSFRDPMREIDKLHSLYDTLMDARRESGDDVVPFHKFAALVKDQVSKLRDAGSPEVAFRVAMKDGKVNFTVRGVKTTKE